MRIWWILSAALVAISLSGAHAQLAVGPGGLRTPPINLVSVFRFLRDIFMAYMYPPTPGSEVKTTKNDDAKLIPVRDEKDMEAVVEPSKKRVSVLGYDTDGNIVEKFDTGCSDDSSIDCIPKEEEEEERIDDALDENLLPMNRTADGTTVADAFEDKTASMQLVVGKWPVLYITLISILSWLIIMISTPYILTGDTIGRREDDVSAESMVDQQDVLLLLAWLLGAVSEDTSCLERIVCLTPTKSSRYISVSSMFFNVASYLRRWVPYSQRFDNLLDRLEDVTLDGFAQDCHSYYCPTIPEL
ncbi:uncharacterized protein LOC135197253 [Macrobrachium nipponense]|uniref:uncharacterized protein LOC135197253 n=1 Tax=Macrobrachium nipponense TaxID=159736 RepID=UPI0030C8145E